MNAEANDSTLRIRKPVKLDETQPPILPKNLKRFSLFDLDPIEVARQLTLIEMVTFMDIKPVELMKQEWARKNTNSVAVNVRAMTTRSTMITGWIISTILAETDVKRRYFVLKFFIKVGEVFSIFFAILTV